MSPLTRHRFTCREQGSRCQFPACQDADHECIYGYPDPADDPHYGDAA